MAGVTPHREAMDRSAQAYMRREIAGIISNLPAIRSEEIADISGHLSGINVYLEEMVKNNCTGLCADDILGVLQKSESRLQLFMGLRIYNYVLSETNSHDTANQAAEAVMKIKDLGSLKLAEQLVEHTTPSVLLVTELENLART